jgi:hypothetical protein
MKPSAHPRTSCWYRSWPTLCTMSQRFRPFSAEGVPPHIYARPGNQNARRKSEPEANTSDNVRPVSSYRNSASSILRRRKTRVVISTRFCPKGARVPKCGSAPGAVLKPAVLPTLVDSTWSATPGCGWGQPPPRTAVAVPGRSRDPSPVPVRRPVPQCAPEVVRGEGPPASALT